MPSATSLCSRPDLTRLPASTPIVSLYLRRVECIDETEHEGIWPFVGEGIANDAIRLRTMLTWQRGSGAPQAQCMSPILDLGSNYQDGTVIRFNERLAVFPTSAREGFPLTASAALVLIEEDWGGQMDEVTERVFHDIGNLVKGEVASATTTAVGAAVAGAIGSVFGPLGTAVGSGIGAAVGWLVQQIGAGLDSLKSDAFPPQDAALVVAGPANRFSTGTRLTQMLDFTAFGGTYRLTCEWRFGKPDRRVALRTHSGNFVMALNGGGGVVNAASRQPAPREWETFVLEDVAPSQVSLRAGGGQVLSAEAGGGGLLVANRALVGPWETFTIAHLGAERVALRAPNGKFLCAENGGGGDLLFNRDGVAEWETFTLQVL
jgi:hypothetical protein